jgi:hypothetical protein
LAGRGQHPFGRAALTRPVLIWRIRPRPALLHRRSRKRRSQADPSQYDRRLGWPRPHESRSYRRYLVFSDEAEQLAATPFAQLDHRLPRERRAPSGTHRKSTHEKPTHHQAL